MNINNHVPVETKMSFDEFCKPFEETANMLSKRGITEEQLKKNVNESRRKYAESHLRY